MRNNGVKKGKAAMFFRYAIGSSITGGSGGGRGSGKFTCALVFSPELQKYAGRRPANS